jgi:uncharacterized protein YbbC (DUF1343 family)
MKERPTIATGLSALSERPELLASERVGLLTNFTGVTAGLDRNVDALLAAGVRVTALLGPEHGIRGTAQAGESESESVDQTTGLPLADTYEKSADELDEFIELSEIDTIVYDMQDIGARFWTYTWTMFDCMMAAARTGKRFVVLDRPNPIGGLVTAGPGLDPSFSSFVGRVDLPVRHGLTSGELAMLFNARDLEQPIDLRVIPMVGWQRGTVFEETDVPWIAPSPNLPTVDTAFVFSGTGLVEGTNASEGRGTTRPFELVGAPYVDGRFLGAMRERELPGVQFRDAWFAPTFHKHAGETVRGVQLHVTDRAEFDPVDTGVSMLAVLAELYPSDFAVLPPREGVAAEKGYALDRLWGSDSLRLALAAGRDPRELLPLPSSPELAYPELDLLY